MNRLVAAKQAAVALALVGALAVAALQAPAAANAVSPGCDQLNLPAWDGFYIEGVLTNMFAAGEHISMAAGPPATGSPAGIQLKINGVAVATATFPGSVGSTFASSGTYTVDWGPTPTLNTLTWTVSCTGPVAAAFRRLSVTRTKRGALVRWRAAPEVDTLGFNVYRAAQGRRVRANAHLLLARGGAYSFLDRSAPRAMALRYWIQAVSPDASQTWYGPARLAKP